MYRSISPAAIEYRAHNPGSLFGGNQHYWNNSDWFDLNGTGATPADAAAATGTTTAPQPIDRLKVCFNSTYIFTAPTSVAPNGISPTPYVRLAILTVPLSQRMGELTSFNGNLVYISAAVSPSTRQGNFENPAQQGFAYDVTQVQSGRGAVVGTWWGYSYEYSPDSTISQNTLALAPYRSHCRRDLGIRQSRNVVQLMLR